MARKNYTEEFRRQAVDLYRSTPGATLRGIAADLGISRHTLQVWVHALDPELDPGPTNPSSELSSVLSSGLSSVLSSGPAATQGNRAGRAGSAAELAALRARVAALETENVKLETERDILRQAAKYFAGETNW
jgi:transposase